MPENFEANREVLPPQEQIAALFAELILNTREISEARQAVLETIQTSGLTPEAMSAYQQLVDLEVDKQEGVTRALWQIKARINSAEVYFIAELWDNCLDDLEEMRDYAANMLDRDQDGQFKQILKKIDALLELVLA